MSALGFDWFPTLKGEERVLMLIDAKLGHIVNLDGSSPADSTRATDFFRSFGTRSDALEWAKRHRPSGEVICLLYDKERVEEFVPMPTTGERNSIE